MIGLGPGPTEYMSEKAVEEARRADVRMADGYTSVLLGSGLEELIGSIEWAGRPYLEDPDEWFLAHQGQSVAVLIPGDPMVSTTHVTLMLDAQRAGFDVEVVHGISIFDLVGGLGLQSTRFGRIVSLVYPYAGLTVTSPLEHIAFNRWQGLHTLVLLDLDPSGEGITEPKPMSPKAAYEALLQAHVALREREDGEFAGGEDYFSIRARVTKRFSNENLADMNVALCSDLGSHSQRIEVGCVKDLKSAQPGIIHTLVIPAELHDIEERMWRSHPLIQGK